MNIEGENTEAEQTGDAVAELVVDAVADAEARADAAEQTAEQIIESARHAEIARLVEARFEEMGAWRDGVGQRLSVLEQATASTQEQVTGLALLIPPSSPLPPEPLPVLLPSIQPVPQSPLAADAVVVAPVQAESPADAPAAPAKRKPKRKFW